MYLSGHLASDREVQSRLSLDYATLSRAGLVHTHFSESTVFEVPKVIVLDRSLSCWQYTLGSANCQANNFKSQPIDVSHYPIYNSRYQA